MLHEGLAVGSLALPLLLCQLKLGQLLCRDCNRTHTAAAERVWRAGAMISARWRRALNWGLLSALVKDLSRPGAAAC